MGCFFFFFFFDGKEETTGLWISAGLAVQMFDLGPRGLGRSCPFTCPQKLSSFGQSGQITGKLFLFAFF